MTPLLGDRLAVGLRTLTPPTQVRILVPQPFILKNPLQILSQYVLTALESYKIVKLVTYFTCLYDIDGRFQQEVVG